MAEQNNGPTQVTLTTDVPGEDVLKRVFIQFSREDIHTTEGLEKVMSHIRTEILKMNGFME